jgi:hypothetical protein
MLGPYPVKVDIINYETPKIMPRPRLVSEDVYDLYFNRAKILFPKASETDIEKYLDKKYSLRRSTDPAEKKIKGKKVFYFKAIYDSGNFSLKSDSLYSDWAWVPRMELNKYLDEETYKRFIKVITR